MTKTLIVTDVQRDFMPGGALGIPGADAIIPVINRLIPHFDHVLAVRDWHPPHHISFASTHHKKPGEVVQIGQVKQILWPDHCVQNTQGSEFAANLDQKKIQAIFHKGIEPKVDSYSAFFDSARHRSTGLADYLRQHHLSELYFVGVATDYCILYSVLDAIELGFQTAVIRDGCRPINLKPRDEEIALERMRAKGARILQSLDLT